MSRNRRDAGTVKIVCRDPRHRGTRHVTTLEFAERAPNSEGPRITLFWEDNAPGAPAVKQQRREDGQWVIKFACTCRRTPERTESYLVGKALQNAAANPGRRPEIDLVDLG